jgi:hypothetical protein
LKEILDVNIREEEGAIQLYGSILQAVGHEGAILFETVEDIFLRMNRNTKKN